MTPQILESAHRSTLALARGFSGVKDPTVIWESMVRDFRTAFLFYRELEEKDDDIAGALEMLKLAVLNRDREITPGDDSQAAADAAAFLEQQLDQLPSFPEILEAALDAPAYGVSISEILFDVSEGQVGLIDIKDRPQELFSFNPQWMLQTGPLRLMANPFSYEGGDLVPEQKFLVFSFRPRNGNRRGRPLLRRCFWPSWFKRNVLRFWLRFAEKGPGTAAVMYPQGGNEDEQQKALAAAEAIVEKIAVAIPENFKMVEQLLTSARSQNPAVYKQLSDDCKYAIARAIVGQTLTSFGNEGGSGSRSLGTVHAKMFYLKEVDVALKLQTVINDQLVKPLHLWNFGPNIPRPKWCIVTEDEEDLVRRITIDSKLQSMGMPIGRKYAQEKYGLPDVDETKDEILTPPQGAAPNAISTGVASIPDFSDEEARHNDKEVRQLLDAFQSQLGSMYKQRIADIAAAIQGGGL